MSFFFLNCLPLGKQMWPIHKKKKRKLKHDDKFLDYSDYCVDIICFESERFNNKSVIRVRWDCDSQQVFIAGGRYPMSEIILFWNLRMLSVIPTSNHFEYVELWKHLRRGYQ